MNQLPKSSTTPDIDAYWRFATDSKHAGKVVIKAEGNKIWLAPKLFIGSADLITVDKNNKLYHSDPHQIVEHFKTALANKYRRGALPELFSDHLEKKACCDGLTQDLIKKVAENVQHHFIETISVPSIDAYWQFAADPNNEGKVVVEVSKNRFQSSKERLLHPDSTEVELKLVDHHAVVEHFKEVLCNKYGREVLRSLFSKAQEEEALYSGLTYEIVKKVADHAKVVELFQHINKSREGVIEAQKRYNALSSSATLTELGEAELELGRGMLRYQSLVSTFKKMVAADPANIVFQIKLKSSYLDTSELGICKTPLQVAQLLLDAHEHCYSAAKQLCPDFESEKALSQDQKNLPEAAKKNLEQSYEAFDLLLSYAKDPEAPKEVKDFVDNALTI